MRRVPCLEFKSSGLLGSEAMLLIPDVSKERNAFISKGQGVLLLSVNNLKNLTPHN
jgi:hypothetical protein